MNVCVAPHLTGEVILQSYNCVLTISSLYQNTDGIILIENDAIESICNKLLNLKRPTLTEMNKVKKLDHYIVLLFFLLFHKMTNIFFDKYTRWSLTNWVLCSSQCCQIPTTTVVLPTCQVYRIISDTLMIFMIICLWIHGLRCFASRMYHRCLTRVNPSRWTNGMHSKRDSRRCIWATRWRVISIGRRNRNQVYGVLGIS